MRCFEAALVTLAFAWPAAAPGAELAGTPLVEGLKTPTKVVLTRGGNLLVSEAGDRGAAFVVNHGRVSLVDRGGDRRTLLDRLPSGLDLEGFSGNGPTALWVADRYTLYVAIGVGDATRRGGPPAFPEIPNPAGPSSALLSSLWRVRFSVPIDDVGDVFALDPAAHYGVLADGRELRLVNASGDRARIRVLADFRDLYPGAPPNVVSASNPFGLLLDEDRLYLPDAAQNSLVRVDRDTGRIETITHFPPVPNTLPFPSPLVDAVPTAIRKLSHDSALVTLLSGFPFGLGASSIQKVDLGNGSISSFISGLTMAIDVLPLGDSKGPLLVLEYASRFDPPGPTNPPRFVPPGRLLRFAVRHAPGESLSTDLESPTSMAYDDRTGEVFVAEIDTGRIVRFGLWY